MWNKQSHSTLSAGDVAEAVVKRHIIPNQTRWHSTFNAMERIHGLICEKDIAAMNAMCDKIHVPNFSANEVKFISEFVEVMRPLSQALNILHCEIKAFMAYLLPTLVVLKDKLQLFESNAIICLCKPLVQALLTAIDQRFESVFMSQELIAAAIVHPKFKTFWIKDAEQQRIGLEYTKRLLKVQLHRIDERRTEMQNAALVLLSPSDDDDDFFTFHQQVTIGNADSILNNFLGSSTVTSVKELHLFPAIQQIFIELNTALPASTPCERLFSIAGRLFRPARCSMTDDHFEQQLLLTANSSL